MLNIGYIPYDGSENAYTERCIDILNRFGKVSSPPHIRQLLKHPLRIQPNSFDFIILNWVENCIVDRQGKISTKGIFKLFIQIILLKIVSRKLIFVRHNNYPHNATHTSAKWAEKVIDLTEYLCDHVITHSGHNAQPKRAYIPHPLYHLPNQLTDSEAQIEKDYFLVFGRILPYKKIERLIEAAPSGVNLLVAGSAPDHMYVEKLRRAAKNKSVHILPGFISDDEAVRLFKAARGVVISHNDSDMIVSGTFFYSLSAGTPVYAISSPFIEWAQRTLKVPGLHVANCIDALCSLLAQNREARARLDEQEQKVIEELFGDASIEKEWAQILGHTPTMKEIN